MGEEKEQGKNGAAAITESGETPAALTILSLVSVCFSGENLFRWVAARVDHAISKVETGEGQPERSWGKLRLQKMMGKRRSRYE